MPQHRVTQLPDGTISLELDYSNWHAELRESAIRLLTNKQAWQYVEYNDEFELVDLDLEGLSSMDQFRVLGGIGLELLTKAVCLKRQLNVLQAQSATARRSHYSMFKVRADANPWLAALFHKYEVNTVADLNTRSFGECIQALQSDLAQPPSSIAHFEEIIRCLDRWRAFNRNMDCHLLHSIVATQEYEVKLPQAVNGLLRIYPSVA